MPKCDFNLGAKQLRVVLISPVGIRSSPSEMFLGKGVLRICRKSAGKDTCRSVISVRLLYKFIKIALRHGYSSVNFQNTFSYEHLWRAASGV